MIDAGGHKLRTPTLLERLAKKGIGTDAHDFLTVISGYCRAGQLDSALGILAQRKESDSCCPNAAKCNALIDACQGRDLYDLGTTPLEEMVDAGMPKWLPRRCRS